MNIQKKNNIIEHKRATCIITSWIPPHIQDYFSLYCTQHFPHAHSLLQTGGNSHADGILHLDGQCGRQGSALAQSSELWPGSAERQDFH